MPTGDLRLAPKPAEALRRALAPPIDARSRQDFEAYLAEPKASGG